MAEGTFRAWSANDPVLAAAHARCAQTIDEFIARLEAREDERFLAKLSFRDPIESERTGRDELFYLWLTDVHYHREENLLSGVFFELPECLEGFHALHERIGFDAEDVFDWMVVDAEGDLRGGFSLRATRASLATEAERRRYDADIGVRRYLD